MRSRSGFGIRTASVLGCMGGCACLLLAGAGASERHIRNGSTPDQGVEVVALEEVWRAGGEHDEEVFFGNVVRVRGDDEGNVHVFDAQQRQVFVFSPGGRLVRRLFREGEGPGEVRRPSDMLLLPDRVGVAESFGGMIVTMTDAGTPGDAIHLTADGGRIGITSAAASGDHLVIGGWQSIPGDRELTSTRVSFLGRFDLAGRESERLLESRDPIDYANSFTFDEATALRDFRWCFDVGPDGRIYALAERNRYAISVFHPDGSLDRIIEREFTPRPRTDKEMRRMQALVDRRFRTFPYDLTTRIAATVPVISWQHRGLQVDGQGRLWVRHSRSDVAQPDGILLTFDVFDPQGRFIKQVALAAEGDAANDGIFLIGDDRFVRVTGFVDAMRTVFGGGQGGFEGEAEPEPTAIICYRRR